MEKENKKYKVGLNISSIGYFVLLEQNKIIDICQVPQKIENKELNKQLAQLKKDSKIKGNKTRCEKEIKIINDKILNLPHDCKRVFEWLSKYKNDIQVVNIEKPLLQSFNPTSIQSLVKMGETMGVIRTMLDLLDIPYNIISISEWRSNFDYKKLSKEEIQELIKTTGKNKGEITREFAKNESIRISEERIENIKDWYILPRCSKINNDIVESALLSLV